MTAVTTTSLSRRIGGLSDFQAGASARPLALSLALMRVVYATRHQMALAVADHHHRLSDTGLRMLMSVRLTEGAPLDLGTLAIEVGVTKANISRELQRMEERGFLTRGEDPDDRRRIRVRTAPHVDRLLSNAMLAVSESVSVSFTPLNTAERLRLMELSHLIREPPGTAPDPRMADDRMRAVEELLPEVDLAWTRAALALGRAADNVRGALDRSLQGTGLSFVAFHALARVTIIDGGDLALPALVPELGVNRGNVSWILRGLETKGLIVRTRDPYDARRIRARATRAGAASVSELVPQLQAAGDAALSVLNRTRRSELSRLLGLLEADAVPIRG